MTTLVEQTGVEAAFAELLADVVRCEDVAADSHFFDDLGADSMVMAQFCARVRKRDDLPSVSIKQVYANPTIRSLAAALDGAAAAQPEPRREQLATPASTAQYVLCGALQLLLGG
jgi:aryl carrier-like protein